MTVARRCLLVSFEPLYAQARANLGLDFGILYLIYVGIGLFDFSYTLDILCRLIFSRLSIRVGQGAPMFSSSGNETLDHLLAQVSRLHFLRARTLFETVGLYRGQPPVLGVLAEGEGVSHSELAARLDVRPATISKMLDRMERAGFLTRRPDAEDQRVSRVYLTERGRAVQCEVRRLIRTMAQETFAGFSLEEQALLSRFLLQIRENLMRATSKADRKKGDAPWESQRAQQTTGENE